jgi:phosphatidate cytidylyltransferase
MHLKRWITALVALPFLGIIIYKGGVFFVVVVGAVGLFSLWEYFRIVFIIEGKKVSAFALVGFLTVPCIFWAAYVNAFDRVLGLIALNLIVSGLISVFQFKNDSSVLDKMKDQVVGVVYVPLFLSFLVLVRNDTDGILWIVLLLCIIFSGDTSAYYVGSYLGRHKLCPAVSPGKTIEGSIGGLVANVAIGSLVKVIFLPALPWVASITFFLVIGVLGQIGDLFESEMKRKSKVKDSGGLLPGHGGFLDRIDALLFAAPAVYFFKEYIFC